MSIYKKLSDARAQFRTREVKKSGYNTFSKIYYMQLKDFLHETELALQSSGLIAIVSFGIELATMTVRELEGDGVIEITSPMSTAALKGCHEVQNLGAVQTYIRRYLWVALFEIIEQDAVDESPPNNDVPAAAKFPELTQVDLDTFADMKFSDKEGLKLAYIPLYKRGKANNQTEWLESLKEKSDMHKKTLGVSQ